MDPAKTFRPVSKLVVDLVLEDQRLFPTNRDLADERSMDQSADDLLLRKFLPRRLDSPHRRRDRKQSQSAARRLRPGAAIQPPRRGRSKFPFSLRQFCGKNTLGLLLTKCFQSLTKFFVTSRQNRDGKKGCVFGAGIADRQSSNRNPAGHLRGRQQRIKTLQLRLNWNA